MKHKKRKHKKRYIDDLYSSRHSDSGRFYEGDGTSHRKGKDMVIRKQHIVVGVALLLFIFITVCFIALPEMKKERGDETIVSSAIPPKTPTATAQKTDSSPWLSIDTDGVVYFHPEYFNGDSLTIPKWLNEKTVTGIDGESFSAPDNTIKTITLHEGVKIIGEGAFSQFSALETVKIPSTLKRVGAGAFKNTPWYKNNTEEFFAVGDGVLIKYGGSSAEVTVPDGIKAIDCAVFLGCSAEKIVMPNTVTYIGSTAFKNCSATEITISQNLNFCESDAFQNCIWLNNRTEDFVIEGAGVLLKCNKSDTTLRIPRDVTMISSLMPNGTGKNVTLVLGKNLRSIANLNELGRVKAFKVEGGNKYLTARSGVLYSADGGTLHRYPIYKKNDRFYMSEHLLKIGNYAFSETDITDIELYDGITHIGQYAFYNCKKLKSITIPDTVTSLGVSAFRGCEALKSATVSENIKLVPHSCFYGCKSLDSVVLSENMLMVQPFSFVGCSSLKYFYIGAKVQDVSLLAFDQEIEFAISQKNRYYTIEKGKLKKAESFVNPNEEIKESSKESSASFS